MEIHYEENSLTAEQLLELREAIGQHGDKFQIEKSLKAGLYTIVAKTGETAVGMGRLVGDGVTYWHIQDFIVHPQYQRQGIGNAIMERIMAHIKKNSLPNTIITIGLFCAKDKESFYGKFGFIARPNEIYGAGMSQNILISS